MIRSWNNPLLSTFFKHLDGAWDVFWIKSVSGTFIALQKKLVQPSKSNHSIWKILFVLGADEYIERLEGKIRKCLFFYVKIF